MFERSFGVSLRRSVDEVDGGSPGMDTGIAGGGGGSPGTIGTDAGTTGAGMAGTIGTETTGCTRTGAVVEDCIDTTAGGAGGTPEPDADDEFISL